jgi:hypothetical protein
MRSAIFRIFAAIGFCWLVFGTLSLLSELRFLLDGLDWSVSHVSISIKDALLEIGKRISQAVSGYREFVRELVRLLHLPHLPPVMYDVLAILGFSIGRGYWLNSRHRAERNTLIDTEIENFLIRNKLCTDDALEKTKKVYRESVLEDMLQVAGAELLPSSPYFNLIKQRPIDSWSEMPKLIENLRRIDRQQRLHSLARGIHRYIWKRFLGGEPFLPKRSLFYEIELATDCLVYGGLVCMVLSILFGIDYVYRHHLA